MHSFLLQLCQLRVARGFPGAAWCGTAGTEALLHPAKSRPVLYCFAGDRMQTSHCEHARTILIAKDEHEEYLECLDCGEILNVAEREARSESAAVDNTGESLSDA